MVSVLYFVGFVYAIVDRWKRSGIIDYFILINFEVWCLEKNMWSK